VSSNDDFKSAYLKLNRASKHISEVSSLLQEERPFRYILKTDVKSGKRFLGPKVNEAVIDDISLICGDAIHNLRAAIDHAYITVLKPYISSPSVLRSIQFPFSRTATDLEKACRTRRPLCQGSCPLLYFSLFLRWAG